MLYLPLFLGFMGLLASTPLLVSEDRLSIDSEHLGRTIKVTVADLATDQVEKPIVYVTDGQKALDAGLLDRIKALTEAGTVAPAYYVFVSTKDAQTGTDRRNEYFFCNPDYLAFFNDELLPTVEDKIGHAFVPQERSLVGISFGGLNAAYFATTDLPIYNYGLLSPSTYPCRDLSQKIAFGPDAGRRIFISTGTDDTERYVDELLPLYRNRDFELKEVRTEGGHDFNNWIGQLEELLVFLL